MKKKIEEIYINCREMPKEVRESFVDIVSEMCCYHNGSLVDWGIDLEDDEDDKTKMEVHEWLIKQGYKDGDTVQIKWSW